MKTVFFKPVTIITENANGEVYAIGADSLQEILDDWHGACDFVPANDAPVHGVFVRQGCRDMKGGIGLTFEAALKLLQMAGVE